MSIDMNQVHNSTMLSFSITKALDEHSRMVSLIGLTLAVGRYFANFETAHTPTARLARDAFMEDCFNKARQYVRDHDAKMLGLTP